VVALGLVALLALPGSASAQTSLPFPMAHVGSDALTGLHRVELDHEQLPGLFSRDAVRLTGMALPGGGQVDLELERLDLGKHEFGFYVDGLPAPGLLDGLALSVWQGKVVGDESSNVLLSFSARGSRGWVQTGGELVHLMPQPGANNNWADDHALLARESELEALGSTFTAACGLDALAGGTRDAKPISVPSLEPPVQGSYQGSCDGWSLALAIETDDQLFNVFGDLGAETAYLTTLLAASSARYEEQINTVFTFPYVQYYTQGSDPWFTPESGGSMLDMLDEFEAAWAGSVPNGAIIGHFVSGAGLGGGVAYLGALCDTSQTFSFAVSGNISGDTPFPIAVGPLNWDFMVFSHETGHNFNSPHTHDYSPQIDNCAGGTCITDGTIMSYCHQCPGGMTNITTFFQEPDVVNVMMAHAASCLPTQTPLTANVSAQPVLITPGTTTALQAEVQGVPVGGVDLNWRPDSGSSFQAVAMADQGGGTWSGDLPAQSCGDEPEWFFSMNDASCGVVATDTFAAEVGSTTVLLAEDFESGSSWTSGAAGDDATTGVWELGDPIGTGAQPEDDFTSGGTDCWFTQQGPGGGGLGDNDVDGGTTTLTTSAIDLSSGDARIGYWRWYSNDAGNSPNADIFVVDVSNGGAWVNVETVGPAGAGTSGGWFWNEFTVSSFVTPNSSVQVRFVASDFGDGSIVEAAIDEFSVFRVDCGGTCQPSLGFGGPGSATLSLCGGDLSTGTNADLVLSGAASNATAFILAGLTNSPTPAKGGVVVPVPWDLLLTVTTDGSGSATLGVAGGNGPLTVFVQAAYQDGGLPQGYGFSNALSAAFLP
jgi:hypothetical protein